MTPHHHLGATQVQDMFTRVAPRYDRANTVMTLGMDRRWRRLIQRQAQLEADETLLDLATGTGQLALDARRRVPGARIIAGDLTDEMLGIARRQPLSSTIDWMVLDARSLPFADESIDVITHGYLLRYLVDLEAGLREQLRVLRPGGRVVALETSPGKRAASIGARMASYWPRIVGRLLSSSPDDYAYLQESTMGFVPAAHVTRAFESAGFVGCGHRQFLQGMITVHWASRPYDP